MREGEVSEQEVRAAGENVTRVVHGDVTIGTSPSNEPTTEGQLLRDASQSLVYERSAYVVIQEDVRIPVPGGAGRMAGEEPSEEDASGQFVTMVAWVVDAATGERLMGWSCVTESN